VSTRFVRSSRVLWRRTSNGVVLLPSTESEPFTLSGSGSVLWEVLAEPVDVEEASQLLGELHGVDAEQVANDIAPVIDELTRRSAVERIE
jgi:hypothetical protein